MRVTFLSVHNFTFVFLASDVFRSFFGKSFPAKQVVLKRLLRTHEFHIKVVLVGRLVYNGGSILTMEQVCLLRHKLYLGLKGRNIACDGK